MGESLLKDVPKLMPLWHGQSNENFPKRFLEDRLLDYGGIGIDINLNQTEMLNCVPKHAVDQVGFKAKVCALPFLPANKISMKTDSCLSSLNTSCENFKNFCLKLEHCRKTVSSKKRYQNYKKEILSSHQKVKAMCKTKKYIEISVPKTVLELTNMFPETVEIPKVNFDYSGGCLASVQRINSNPILLHPTGKKLNKLAFTTIEHCSKPFSSFKPVKSERQVIKLGKGCLQQVTNAVDGYCYIRQNGLVHFVDFTDKSKINHFNLKQNVINIGASHYCPEEFVSADKNGRIELNDINSKKPVWSVENFVYSESANDVPRLCSFGAHPKSVLFVTEKKLFSFDARSEGQNGSVIFSCNHCSCYPEENLISVKGLVVNPFQHFISSSDHLFLCDERYPRKPILLWNHSLKGCPLYCDVTCFSRIPNSSNTVVLLGTQETQELVSFAINSLVQSTVSLGPPLFLSSLTDCVNSLKFHCVNVEDIIVKRLSHPLIGVAAVSHTNSTGFSAFQLTSQGDLFYQDFKRDLDKNMKNIERTYRADMGCVLTPPECILPHFSKWTKNCGRSEVSCNAFTGDLNRLNVSLKDILSKPTEGVPACNICKEYGLTHIQETLNNVCSTCGLENAINEKLLKISVEMSLFNGPSTEHRDLTQFDTFPFLEYTDVYSKKILKAWKSAEDQNDDNQESLLAEDSDYSVLSYPSSNSNVSTPIRNLSVTEPDSSREAAFQFDSQNTAFFDGTTCDMSSLSQEIMNDIILPSQDVKPKVKQQHSKKRTQAGF
ncbi:uncharacterized protein TNCT_203981 [Trichonephila clavata]|uniref:TAF1C helical bundle domain-containing protein n=1 Tax=Trichonephila clavata TaxID=2740835 RepID=A0A8X6L8G8_TRICU|nr:uncharacterized protein TNCT_203981 [Trichonephila clavata]